METRDEDERLALLAAATVQPVVRVVLQARLRERGKRVETRDEDERLALLAAATVQPVVRVTALKHGAGSAAEPGVMTLVRKKLDKSAGALDTDRTLLKEGSTVLEERNMALVSLCNNLRTENRESHLAILNLSKSPPVLGQGEAERGASAMASGVS
ncbi:hypothetical protein T484DRAFT_1884784, partial [Baffinella frigidus]